MAIHSHDPIPLTEEEGPPLNLVFNQPMLHSPIEIANNAKGIESSNAGEAKVLLGNVSAAASDEKRMDDSEVNGNASIQDQPSFDSKLTDLERMLVVRQKMDPDSPKSLDDIIRTQIETLVPALNMESRESSIARYVKRLAEIRKYILSQWVLDHNSWNGDCDHIIKWIDPIMIELMRIMDIQSNSGLERDLDPLTALESLSNIKDGLFDKHGLEKNVEALTEQKILALSLAQYSQNQASHSCPVRSVILTDPRMVQTVDAFNRGKAKAMKMHRATQDKDADIQLQVADLRKDLEQANEKIRQGQSKPSMSVGNFVPNADAWATPICSSAPTEWTASIANRSIPDALHSPVEARNLDPSFTDFRPADLALSSYPQMVSSTPPIGPEYAGPSGLFGTPVINPADQRHYGYWSVGHGLERDDRSSFGPLNTGFRPMGTQMPPPALKAPPPAGFSAVKKTRDLPCNNTNVWPVFTSMPPNVSMQAFNEAHKQMREASIDQSRGQHGLAGANQGHRRRGGVHQGCEHHERVNRGARGGRANYGRGSRDKANGEVIW